MIILFLPHDMQADAAFHQSSPVFQSNPPCFISFLSNQLPYTVTHTVYYCMYFMSGWEHTIAGVLEIWILPLTCGVWGPQYSNTNCMHMWVVNYIRTTSVYYEIDWIVTRFQSAPLLRGLNSITLRMRYTLLIARYVITSVMNLIISAI